MQLKPYVSLGAKLTEDHKNAVFSKFRGPRGLTPERFLRVCREHTYARLHPNRPVENPLFAPGWMNAQINLKLMDEPKFGGMPLRQYQETILEKRRTIADETGAAASARRHLEVVEADEVPQKGKEASS